MILFSMSVWMMKSHKDPDLEKSYKQLMATDRGSINLP